MGSLFSKELLPNVYIFNRIKNNEKDIQLLHSTFQSLGCVVTEVKVENKTCTELKGIVSNIATANFKDFKYIVIIILDNENEDEYVWKTMDNQNFHINGDLMTRIFANKTLEGKFRFFILQTNRVSDDSIILRRKKRQTCYPGKDLKYYATSTGCVLNHKWTSDTPSPFIQNLCEEIVQNSLLSNEEQLSIEKVLDNASAKESGEFPARTHLPAPYFLRSAK